MTWCEVVPAPPSELLSLFVRLWSLLVGCTWVAFLPAIALVPVEPVARLSIAANLLVGSLAVGPLLFMIIGLGALRDPRRSPRGALAVVGRWFGGLLALFALVSAGLAALDSVAGSTDDVFMVTALSAISVIGAVFMYPLWYFTTRRRKCDVDYWGIQ